jgi:antitoxin VapB
MALNIKNEEAHRLATELAERRGTNLTEAVTEALRDLLRRSTPSRKSTPLEAEVTAIQRFVADLPDCDTRSPDEILGYDGFGLPVS